MKKNLQKNNILKAALLLLTSSILMLSSCKKNDSPTDPTVAEKKATFSADLGGTAVNGTDFLEFSYITTNDEFLEIPYAEIHIAGSNTMLDVMIANPAVKQYNFAATTPEASALVSLNGTMYEATPTSSLNITEATSSKISGTLSGTFKNVNTTATIVVSNCNFTAQF